MKSEQHEYSLLFNDMMLVIGDCVCLMQFYIQNYAISYAARNRVVRDNFSNTCKSIGRLDCIYSDIPMVEVTPICKLLSELSVITTNIRYSIIMEYVCIG